jgi:DNA-binding PadR family transcriptional regulator
MAITTETKFNVEDLRLLLALWELSQNEALPNRSTLIKAAKKSSQKVSEYDSALKISVQSGYAREFEKDKVYQLTEAGKAAIREGLKNQPEELMPEADSTASVVGRRDYERLLKWMQQELIQAAKEKLSDAATVSTVTSNEETTAKTITSYDAFKDLALEIHDMLNRDYNYDNLVPIYRIRREIGDRVSRLEFSNWLLEMQAEDILLLMEGSVEDSAPDKIQDSVTTAFGELRCYAQKMAN